MDHQYFVDTYGAAIQKMTSEKSVRLDLPKDFMKQWAEFEAKNPRAQTAVELKTFDTSFNEWDIMSHDLQDLQSEAVQTLRPMFNRWHAKGLSFSICAYIVYSIVGIVESELRMGDNLEKRAHRSRTEKR